MKSLTGVVLKVNDPKTVKVEVAFNWQHPVYKKFVKRTKKYLCGLAEGVTVAAGDQVVLQESRPLSLRKRFIVTENLATK
jgi:small subunit ribosomal protein S17